MIEFYIILTKNEIKKHKNFGWLEGVTSTNQPDSCRGKEMEREIDTLGPKIIRV